MLLRCTAPLVLALVLAAPAAGGGIDLDVALDAAGFAELTDHLAEGVAMPLGPARGLGAGGIQLGLGAIWVDTGAAPAWWEAGVDDVDLLADGAHALRADLRLGLPWGLEAGAQVGRLAGETYWGADLRRRFTGGGVLGADLALRASYGRLAAGELDLDVATVDLVASKSFLVLTPYLGGGFRLAGATGRWDELPELEIERDELTAVVTGGAEVHLPFGRLRLEARRGSATTVFVGLGVGFGGMPRLPLP